MSEIAKLKIGLDFHGVINTAPDYFKDFAACALSRGHEIHVLTGGPYEKVKQYLHEHGIGYTRIYAILDDYERKGEVEFFENGEFKVDDILWDIAKAKYCVDNHIDFHIDDTKKYAKWFVTPFCYFDEIHQSCQAGPKVHIDFSSSPEKAVREIENLSLA